MMVATWEGVAVLLEGWRTGAPADLLLRPVNTPVEQQASYQDGLSRRQGLNEWMLDRSKDKGGRDFY